MELERITKNGVELIIVPYSQNKRGCVIIVYRDGKIEPKFPFNNEAEAKKFISDFK